MMVHLCEKHLSEWGETPESTIAARMRTLARKMARDRKRCINADCRALINYPDFSLCEHCARKHRQCQVCSTSTLTREEELAARAKAEQREVFDAAVDLYTLAVKTYGLSSTRTLLLEEAPWKGELLQDVLDLGFSDIDYGRENRPIWKHVLGTDIYRCRWCASCAKPSPYDPALTRGDLCGHLTVGRVAAYCPLCAAEAGACERCGDPA